MMDTGYYCLAFHRFLQNMPFLWKKNLHGYTNFMREAKIFSRKEMDNYDYLVYEEGMDLTILIKKAMEQQHGKANIFMSINHVWSLLGIDKK